MGNKKCIKCGLEFPFTAEFFPADKSLKYGLMYTCRACKRKSWNRADARRRKKGLKELNDILIEMNKKQKYGRKKDGENYG